MKLEEIQAAVNQVPFFRYLNIHIDAHDDDSVDTTMPFEDRLIGNHLLQNIHGGIISSFMEATCSLAVFDKPDNGKPKPINLTVDYLRPAKAKSVHCRARIIRSGRRFASVEAQSWQDDFEKPVAKGLFHFLLV